MSIHELVADFRQDILLDFLSFGCNLDQLVQTSAATNRAPTHSDISFENDKTPPGSLRSPRHQAEEKTKRLDGLLRRICDRVLRFMTDGGPSGTNLGEAQPPHVSIQSPQMTENSFGTALDPSSADLRTSSPDRARTGGGSPQHQAARPNAQALPPPAPLYDVASLEATQNSMFASANFRSSQSMAATKRLLPVTTTMANFLKRVDEIPSFDIGGGPGESALGGSPLPPLQQGGPHPIVDPDMTSGGGSHLGGGQRAYELHGNTAETQVIEFTATKHLTEDRSANNRWVLNGRYEFRRNLGRGAQGSVWKVKDLAFVPNEVEEAKASPDLNRTSPPGPTSHGFVAIKIVERSKMNRKRNAAMLMVSTALDSSSMSQSASPMVTAASPKKSGDGGGENSQQQQQPQQQKQQPELYQIASGSIGESRLPLDLPPTSMEDDKRQAAEEEKEALARSAPLRPSPPPHATSPSPTSEIQRRVSSGSATLPPSKVELLTSVTSTSTKALSIDDKEEEEGDEEVHCCTRANSAFVPPSRASGDAADEKQQQQAVNSSTFSHTARDSTATYKGLEGPDTTTTNAPTTNTTNNSGEQQAPATSNKSTNSSSKSSIRVKRKATASNPSSPVSVDESGGAKTTPTDSSSSRPPPLPQRRSVPPSSSGGPGDNYDDDRSSAASKSNITSVPAILSNRSIFNNAESAVGFGSATQDGGAGGATTSSASGQQTSSMVQANADVLTCFYSGPSGDYSAMPENLAVEILCGLSRHPNILPLLEVIDDPRCNNVFLVMPLAKPFPCRVRRDGVCNARLPPSRVLQHALEAASALALLHSTGVVHCDIKLDNFLLLEGQLVLSDFGICQLGQGIEVIGGGNGTIAYWAPECFSHEGGGSPLTVATDCYALGVSLYAMFFGRFPYWPKQQEKKATEASPKTGALGPKKWGNEPAVSMSPLVWRDIVPGVKGSDKKQKKGASEAEQGDDKDEASAALSVAMPSAADALQALSLPESDAADVRAVLAMLTGLLQPQEARRWSMAKVAGFVRGGQ